MATMNISLPDQMKDWVEEQSREGRFANSSDYVRELIRRDQQRTDKIIAMQHLVDEARSSGVSSKTAKDIVADGKAYLARQTDA